MNRSSWIVAVFLITIVFLSSAPLHAEEPLLDITSSILESKGAPVIKVTVTNNEEKFVLLDRKLIWGFNYKLLDSAGEPIQLIEFNREQSKNEKDSQPRLLALRPGESYTRQVPLRDGIPSGIRVLLMNYGNGIKGVPCPIQRMKALPTETSKIAKCAITYDPRLVSELANQ